MPYGKKTENGKIVVYNKETGRVYGKFEDTKEGDRRANAQLAILNIKAPPEKEKKKK